MSVAFPESIETERLRFRPPMPQDAETIFAAYAQDLEVCRFMVWTPHSSVEITSQFIRRCVGSWHAETAFPYVLALRDNDAVVGMLEVRPTANRANIGYVLAKAYWGRGLMAEAIRAFATLAFSDLSFFRVEATCDVENRASARVLEKSGFVREGRLARYTVHPNIAAEPRDCWMYATSR